MILQGETFSHLIEFSTGLPTGAVTYSVLGNDGNPLVGYNGLTVNPNANAISLLLVIPANAHTVATPLFERRTLTWTYTTSVGVVNGREDYIVQKPIPFPVSFDGVRKKLGLNENELPNENINLLMAYATFSDKTSLGDLASFQTDGDYSVLKIVDAIEAIAALYVLPTLQLLIARSEESGTNVYTRFGEIDWEMLKAELERMAQEGVNLVSPPVDELAGITIFFTVPRTDPLTGA